MVEYSTCLNLKVTLLYGKNIILNNWCMNSYIIDDRSIIVINISLFDLYGIFFFR